MNQDQKPESCECSLIYELFDGKGNPASAGRAQALINAETLSLKNEAGPARAMALRDIERIVPNNYSIEILLGGNEKLSLSDLGYRFKDFLRILHQNRNELILFDMLAEEEVLIPGLDAEVEVCEPGGRAILQGKSGIRLYKTSLAILPLLGEIIKVPLGCLKEEIRVENYRLFLETDTGEKFTFFKLGGQLDFLKKSLIDALAELAFQTLNYLKELLPQAGPQALAAAAPLLRDGKAAPRNRIEALAPGLWPELEKEICAAEIGESYRYLQTIGKGDKAAFGFKKGLMGSLSGDTLWFLIPVYQADPQAPGNAVALEAGTIRAADGTGGESEDPLAGGGGQATYFFRLMSRKEYAQSASSGVPDARIDEWISRFNRAMLAVNFRREPIYLSAEKLREPAFRHYRYSLVRLPELLMLRGLFIGRVIHRTPDQWRADVNDLLRFNVRSNDDSLRWKKGE